MKINFKITDTPTGEQLNHLDVYLEGTLEISFGNILFFSQPGILLIEFASFIHKWLDKIESAGKANFIYETMDHDEPILTIKYVKDENYRIDSIWREKEMTQMISKKEIITEFKKYLDNLNDALKLGFNIELKAILS